MIASRLRPATIAASGCCLALLAAPSSTVLADEPQPVREDIEWVDIWLPENSVGDRPRVLLIGDSITRGYYQGVADCAQRQSGCGPADYVGIGGRSGTAGADRNGAPAVSV